MAETKTATYKRYNGTDWDTIYFATSASQVGESSARFFIKPGSNTVNGKQFTENGGITLYSTDIKLSSSDTTTVKDAIAQAMGAIPTGVLTTANYATTLDSVYEKKSDATSAHNTLTNKIDNLTTAVNNRYTKTEIDTKLLNKQDTLTFDTKPIAGSTNPVTSEGINIYVTNQIGEAESTLRYEIQAVKNNATKAYVIDSSVSGKYNVCFNVAKSSSKSRIVIVPVDEGPVTITTKTRDIINLADLHIGDTIYTIDQGIKDWFYGGVEGSVGDTENPMGFAFYQIESDTPVLSGYVQKDDLTDSYSPTTRSPITGIGVKAALDTLSVAGSDQSGKYVNFVSQSGGKVSVGLKDVESNFDPDSKEPANGVAINKALSQSIVSSQSNAGVKVSLGGNVQNPTVSVTVTSGSVASGNTSVVTGGKVYDYVNARATKVFCQADAPTTGVITGDIWIDI